tara:strand:+ start:42818 stop:43804 length:987 start_codon:yes stop_codon:yes gene_type:complete
VAHDPRAPKLAAVSILLALILGAAAIINSQLDFIGNSGMGIEETVLLLTTLVLVGLAKWANTEHAIPEFTSSSTKTSSAFEDFDDVRTPIAAGGNSYQSTTSRASSQTTANILSSILGQEQQTNEEDVRSAISTLSTGEFGMRAQQEAKTTEFAKEDNHRRDSAPTSEETGAVLKRVVVQPVPLPGREQEILVNPTTILGFEPDRVFVTEGVDHVPLPELPNVTTQIPQVEPEVKEMHVESISTSLPELPEFSSTDSTEPSLPELPELSTEVALEPSLPELPDLPKATVAPLPLPELPDLDDLFGDSPEVEVQAAPVTPDLPNLDDLF